MKQQVKNFVKNYIEDIDKANAFELIKKQKEERMLLIKAAINLGNELEKSSLFDKMIVMYPMSIHDQTLRSVPINFKTTKTNESKQKN